MRTCRKTHLAHLHPVGDVAHGVSAWQILAKFIIATLLLSAGGVRRSRRVLELG